MGSCHYELTNLDLFALYCIPALECSEAEKNHQILRPFFKLINKRFDIFALPRSFRALVFISNHVFRS